MDRNFWVLLPLYSLCRQRNFFLKDENFIAHLSKVLRLFSDFSGLKPNTTKCEIAGVGVLKRVQAAVCGIKCIDLRNEAIKTLGTYFSYNQKIEDDKNFVTLFQIYKES